MWSEIKHPSFHPSMLPSRLAAHPTSATDYLKIVTPFWTRRWIFRYGAGTARLRRKRPWLPSIFIKPRIYLSFFSSLIHLPVFMIWYPLSNNSTKPPFLFIARFRFSFKGELLSSETHYTWVSGSETGRSDQILATQKKALHYPIGWQGDIVLYNPGARDRKSVV